MKKFLVLSLMLLATLSCKKNFQPDNLYKFREYIYFTTSGTVSVTSPVQIVFSKDVTKLSVGKALPSGMINISPDIKGQYILKDNRTIEIYPEKNLKPNTEYSVTVPLDKLFEKVPSEFKKFRFQFKTIEPNFTINTGNIQSYNKDWQFLEGELKSADYLNPNEFVNILSAQQKNKALKIKWQESKNNTFNFYIDSIQRFTDDSEVELAWNGKKAGIDNSGTSKIKIPGKNQFVIVNFNPVQLPEQYLEINFSDPLKKSQNFDGLVNIDGAGSLNYSVDGNVLRVYPQNKVEGNITVEVFAGIESQDGFKLKKNVSEVVEFSPVKPGIRVLKSGVILPDSKNLKYNFEAVNLKAVTVRVIKIYENNVLQFLQENELHDNDMYQIRKVGRRVAKKKFTLLDDEKKNTGKWTAYAIDLAQIMKTDPGSIYRIELSFDQDDIIYNCKEQNETNVETESEDGYEEEGEYYYDDNQTYTQEEAEDIEEREEQYWDNLIYEYKRYNYNWEQRENPCHPAFYTDDKIVVSNLLATNIGLIAKRGQQNNYYFTATDIITTQPLSGCKINVYNYQKQEIGSVSTNSDGFAELKVDKNAYFAVATHNKQKTYLKLADGNALSFSKFDVSGKEMKKGLKGYLYGERGVWRPGDTLHLTFVLNDQANPLPKGHPINFELRDARGQLVYKQMSQHDENTFHKFIVPTNADAPTGNWNAAIKVGGAVFNQTLKIATVKPNRLKINLDLGADEIIASKNGIKGTITLNWLHGAVAKNLKTDIKMKISSASEPFKNLKNYIFNDPTREYSEEEINLYEGQVNAEGKATFNKTFPPQVQAPGMLKAQFLTQAYEPGGDFSMDVFSKNIAPFSHFVGLEVPKTDAYGSYTTDKNTTFNIITVNEQGKPTSRNNIEVRVYKIDWRWWWSSSDDNLANYVSSQFHEQVYDKTLQTDASGKATFSLKIPNDKGGRYLIRILDSTSGHATGIVTYFYRDWWRAPQSNDDQSANMLLFATDKTTYNVGETAHITFPSGSDGRALISIENGNAVIDRQWVNTQKSETKVNLPITAEMSPNVYINISLLQPHAITANDLPLRLYGIIPISVEDPQTKLVPKIAMPDVLKPEENFTVKVSEQNGKPMTYTLAVVDEGLLDITRFKTPNIWNEFNQKQALGVMTWDIFDEVIGAYGGTIDQVFSIGGDEGMTPKKAKKANRFKPVVMYIGPFRLESGKTATHTLKMPNYVGAVRVMLVAGNNEKSAYGSAEKSVPVRKPLMILASLPRKLSSGEQIMLPVTVFAMENKVKNVTIQVKTDNGITVLGNATQSLSFDRPDEKMLYYNLDVSKAKGVKKIQIVASGNGETASYDVEIDVENPNPVSNKYIDSEIPANQTQEISFDTFGETGTNSAQIQISTIPTIDFNRRLQYLIQYPHGCVEQTTSSVFPQLYLNDLFDLTAQQKQKTENNIKEGIKALGRFQNSDGGLGYWQGDRTANDWGTSYAGHFMLEAEKKGFVLPLTFKNNWLKYQKQAAKTWRATSEYYYDDLAQAYRLYTLALAGEADLASMNRLKEFKELSNDARWRLSAAYALAGQADVAKKLANQATLDIQNPKYDYYTYGSDVRNRALALETMLLTKDKRYVETAQTLAKDLNADSWMSTQSTAYALLSISKMVSKNGGKSIDASYSINQSVNEHIKSVKSMAIRTINLKEGRYNLKFTNHQQNVLFVRVVYSGKLPVGNEEATSRNLNINVAYYSSEGKVIDSNRLAQGTDFKAVITVNNASDNRVENIALIQIFPGGWEIVNSDFAGYGTTAAQADYVDIRDDRVNFYFGLKARQSKSFTVNLNATYLGKYYRFGTQAEAMYDNNYFARTQGNWIEVVQ